MSSYRYRLSADGAQPHGVMIYHAEGTNITATRAAGQAFFRRQLTDGFQFIAEAYDFINDGSIDWTYLIEAQKLDKDTNVWADDWQANFYKTDCEFDQDAKRVTARFEITDQYTDILNGLNDKIDILSDIDFPIPKVSVNVDTAPIIQLYRENNTFIQNFQGTSSWEEKVSATDGTTLVSNMFFLPEAYGNLYIPADINNTIDPDVSGQYTFNVGNNRFEQDTGTYYVDLTDDINGNYYVREIAGDAIVYTRTGTALPGLTNTNEGFWFVMDSNSTASQIELFVFRYFARILVPFNYLGTSEVRPTTDITPYSERYPYVYKRIIENFFYNDNASTNTTIYKRRDYPRLNVGSSQEYFSYNQPGGVSEKLFECSLSSWSTVSLWFYLDDDLRTIQEDGASSVTIKDAYLLKDVLRSMLKQLNQVIEFNATEEYSEFYFGFENPIDASQREFVIIPKSNLLIGEYDQPQKRLEFTLGNLLDDLYKIHRLKWDITSDNKFRIEHVRYWRNGGSYIAPQIGIDIVNFQDPYVNRAAGTDQNVFRFEKADMAARIESEWSDRDMSAQFNGVPIKIQSKYVDLGKVNKETCSVINTDLDYSLTNPSKVSIDNGVFMASCSLNGDVYEPTYREVIVQSRTYFAQNGDLSFVYLHPTFFIDDAPANWQDINTIFTVSLTTQRQKLQTVTFASRDTIDPQKLITTGLGTGQIESVEESLSGTEKTITVKLDTE